MKKCLLFFLMLFSSSFNLFAQNYNKWNMSQSEIDSIYEMVMKSPDLLQDFVYDTVLYEKCLYAINQEDALFKNRLHQLKHREDSMLNIVYDKVLCRFFINEKEIELSDDFEVFFIVNMLKTPCKIKSEITNDSFSYPAYYKDSDPVLFVFKYNDVLLYTLEKNGIRQDNNVYEYVIRMESKCKVITKNDLDSGKQLLSFSIAYNRPCSNCSCVNINHTFTKNEYDNNSKYLGRRHLKKKQVHAILRYLENQ